MSDEFVPFDSIRNEVANVLAALGASLAAVDGVYLVRDLFGRVRVSVSDAVEDDAAAQAAVRRLAERLQPVLGAHGYPADHAVLAVDSDMLEYLRDGAQEIHMDVPVFWVDRQVTGSDWATVRDSSPPAIAKRYTLYSIKGGVGRSTSAVVLAWYLAQKGERVLVVDLDLESPGLSSTMLDEQELPRFGVTDWFVEDLVGQGGRVIDQMTAFPPWLLDFDGEVHVVPAHGREPGEYLAKLGRVYLDHEGPWTTRLGRMLAQLEERHEPSIVLLESRSGLHDIAAATVTDVDAQVLLFAMNTDSHWTDYEMLFRHWRNHGLAARIRDRLAIVSALTPYGENKDRYLQQFRERSWDLFRDYLYEAGGTSNDPDGSYSFDLFEEDAPHDPIPIHWTPGLAGDASLHYPEREIVSQAYLQFFERFDGLVTGNGNGAA